MKFKKKYAAGVDDLVMDQSLNDAESKRMLEVNTPKKSLKQRYDENKGGYKRALASGKKDKQGNAIDPDTGLTYKILPSKKEAPKPGISLAPPNLLAVAPSLTSITRDQIAAGKPTMSAKTTSSGTIYTPPKGNVSRRSVSANPLDVIVNAFGQYNDNQKAKSERFFKELNEKRERLKRK
jgi:hypothetical protein